MIVSNNQPTCSVLGITRTWANYLCRVPWAARRSNQSILKEISPEYSLGGLRLKLKLPILWPPDVKNWLIGKDPDPGKDWRQKEKETAEDKIVGWHHWLDGHEFEKALGVGDGQGSLVCCSRGVAKSQKQLSDWTELNWNIFTCSRRCLTDKSQQKLQGQYWIGKYRHVNIWGR